MDVHENTTKSLHFQKKLHPCWLGLQICLWLWLTVILPQWFLMGKSPSARLMKTARSLMAAYDKRIWVQTTWILVRVWKVGQSLVAVKPLHSVLFLRFCSVTYHYYSTTNWLVSCFLNVSEHYQVGNKEMRLEKAWRAIFILFLFKIKSPASFLCSRLIARINRLQFFLSATYIEHLKSSVNHQTLQWNNDRSTELL